jgi:hypothetical protein
MGKWIKQVVLKRVVNGQWILKQIFNILSHKRNANQNDIEIPSYPSKKKSQVTQRDYTLKREEEEEHLEE